MTLACALLTAQVACSEPARRDAADSAATAPIAADALNTAVGGDASGVEAASGNDAASADGALADAAQLPDQDLADTAPVADLQDSGAADTATETAPETAAAPDTEEGGGGELASDLQVLDGAPKTDSALADSAMADAPAAPDSLPDAATSIDAGPTLPPGAPTDTNVILNLTGAAPGIAGVTTVVAATGDAGTVDPGSELNPTENKPPIAKKDLALPAQLFAHVDPGSYKFIATVMGPQGFPIAAGMTCDAGKPALVTVPPTGMVQVALQVELMTGPGSFAKLCGAPADAPPTQLVTVKDTAIPPPTKDGAAHFMHGLVTDNRLWIAGSQDGVVSFDFAPSGNASKPVNNWQVWGGQLCNRVLVEGSTMYCSSRNGYLHIADVKADGTLAAPQKKWLDQAGALGTEGMAVLGNQLYIAAFGKGLVQADLQLGAKPKFIAAPANASLWSLLPIDAALLAVGGDKGVWVFDENKVADANGPWVAFVPLPGIAAHLALDGSTLFAGDLGGHISVLQVSDPAKPKLVTTLQLPGGVYGLRAQAGLLWAAMGHAVLGLELGGGALPKLLVRGAIASPRYAQDVQAFGASDIVTAEFQAARRMTVAPAFAKDGAVLVAQPAVHAAVGAVGDKLAGTVRLWNLGNKNANVTKLQFVEALGSNAQELAGPWPLAAGQSAAIAFTFTKTLKGVTEHKIVAHTDAPGQESVGIAFGENTWLHAGDMLPAMQYQDADGKLWKVQDIVAGKPAVVLVAAHSCPVAFMALATAARELQPAIAAGQIAAVALNPWDKPSAPEAGLLNAPFPVLFSPLTTKDGHDWSELLDVTLGQPIPFGPPMPMVYVLDKAGKIVLAQWGWHPASVSSALGL